MGSAGGIGGDFGARGSVIRVSFGEELRRIQGDLFPHPPHGRPLSERFWEKVVIAATPGGEPDFEACWLWHGGMSLGGGTVRGIIRLPAPSRRRVYAHRLALVLWTGEDPADRDACHKCDVGLCCNPTHLRWGTHRQNMREYIARWGGIGKRKEGAPAPPRPVLPLEEPEEENCCVGAF